MTDEKWNRCDVCGRFIALEDFERGAVRNLVYPDSDRTSETWETLCCRHGRPETIFTCLRCQANYEVGHQAPFVSECPVCGWRRQQAPDTLERDRQNRQDAYDLH